MKKLYEKSELTFSILWIVVYCCVSGTIRGNLGDDSIFMLLGLLLIAAGIFTFVKKYRLEEKYGLVKWQGKASDYWFYIPMFILMTGNLWRGFALAYSGVSQVFAVLSMLLIGFIEEMLFRGFLFRILLKKDPVPVAITITAVTFGIGHIVNLLAGQANLETVIQVLFAVAWGYIFTFVFYKSGSLLVCIAVHALVDAFSMFAGENITMEWVYMCATILIAVIYCLYLSRKPAALKKSCE
ncbi:MAG: CPBP family intramembrane metalloprotease [Oscillospiraceae bacterium]|nr:CPBP family intramembrane metalloprotease [Oscillospiraceae bacterium]